MDDEEMIRDLTKEMLSLLGHEVLLAKDAIKEILKIDPDAKAIVSSGYSNDPVMANYRQYGFKASIGKPFEMAQLKEIINSVLG
jgi:CheY-like chemotaxis protein